MHPDPIQLYVDAKQEAAVAMGDLLRAGFTKDPEYTRVVLRYLMHQEEAAMVALQALCTGS